MRSSYNCFSRLAELTFWSRSPNAPYRCLASYQELYFPSIFVYNQLTDTLVTPPIKNPGQHTMYLPKSGMMVAVAAIFFLLVPAGAHAITFDGGGDGTAHDTNGSHKLDYVNWTIPHLSTQVFEIIFISKAFELDQDQSITRDIFDLVKEEDDQWATIPQDHSVRFSFEKAVDSSKDITLYAKAADSNQPVRVEVYPLYPDEQGDLQQGDMVATFPDITQESKYKILLTELDTPTANFDLKIKNANIDIDLIIDPSPPPITWTETQPAGDVDKNWRPVASNSDGTKLIAGSFNGRLYTSSDSGATWTERRPAGDADKFWGTVASNSDGTKLIAGSIAGRLYTSSDSGATWTERQPAGNVDRNWQAAASSSDGTKLIAGANGERLYTSSDSGATWTERRPAGDADKFWGTVASNSDGTKLIAGSIAGRLYTSSDSGATWTERRPAGDADKNWFTAASNSDGTKLIAGNSQRLYTSSDSGATWTERQPAGNVDKNWFKAASSNDGTKLIAGVIDGRLYTSSDSGETWAETQPAGNADKAWQAVASSSDGTKLIAGEFNGRLYTGVGEAASTTDFTWDGGGDGTSWDDEDNWDLDSGYPDDAEDTATINTGSANIAMPDGGTTVGELLLDTSFSGTVTAEDSLTIDDSAGQSGDLTITSGTLDLAGYDLTVDGTLTVTDTLSLHGNETISAGTTTIESGSTIIYTGDDDEATDTYTISDITDYHHLTLNSADGSSDTFRTNANITVAGNFTNTAGTFDAATNSNTVTLDGTDQTLTGNTSFYNLTKTESADDTTDETLTFQAGSTTTITNTWTLDGRDSGDRINLVSSSPGTAWNIDPQGTRTLDNIEVTDSTNTNAAIVACTDNCANGDGNTSWQFTAVTATFSAANQTVAEAADSATVTVNLSAATEVDVEVPYTVTGTATDSTDYTITASPITITAGNTSGAITITLTDDTEIESDETIILTMGSPTNASQGATTEHTVAVTSEDAAASPGGGGGEESVTISSGPSIFDDPDTPDQGRPVFQFYTTLKNAISRSVVDGQTRLIFPLNTPTLIMARPIDADQLHSLTLILGKNIYTLTDPDGDLTYTTTITLTQPGFYLYTLRADYGITDRKAQGAFIVLAAPRHVTVAPQHPLTTTFSPLAATASQFLNTVQQPLNSLFSGSTPPLSQTPPTPPAQPTAPLAPDSLSPVTENLSVRTQSLSNSSFRLFHIFSQAVGQAFRDAGTYLGNFFGGIGNWFQR